jgi:hypothetical protein
MHSVCWPMLNTCRTVFSQSYFVSWKRMETKPMDIENDCDIEKLILSNDIFLGSGRKVLCTNWFIKWYKLIFFFSFYTFSTCVSSDTHEWYRLFILITVWWVKDEIIVL